MSTETRAADLLRTAAEAAKCAPCGCARDASQTIAAAEGLSPEVRFAAQTLEGALVEERYECLGCRVCWPADALGLLGDAGLLPYSAASCPTDPVAERTGWPPLPGSYTVLRWGAPVAVCTLGDHDLHTALAAQSPPGVGIIGSLATENLGIERLVSNTVANHHLRFLVVAGLEPRSAVGHLPGASLLALGANGTDTNGRIHAAPGRRPVLQNISVDEITRFRAAIELVDLIGETDLATIINAAVDCAHRDPGPVEPLPGAGGVQATPGYLTPRMTPDPAGYFVVYPDPDRRQLRLEHYTNDGMLDTVIEAATPAECYTAVVDANLISRLDHAAYLGRELARAETALGTGLPYVQDAAPERATIPVDTPSAQPVKFGR